MIQNREKLDLEKKIIDLQAIIEDKDLEYNNLKNQLVHNEGNHERLSKNLTEEKINNEKLQKNTAALKIEQEKLENKNKILEKEIEKFKKCIFDLKKERTIASEENINNQKNNIEIKLFYEQKLKKLEEDQIKLSLALSEKQNFEK